MLTTRLAVATLAADPRELTAAALFSALPGLSSISIKDRYGSVLSVHIRVRIPGEGKRSIRASGYSPANAVRNTLLALDRFPRAKTFLTSSPTCQKN